MKILWWKITDPLVNVWTRWTVCRKHGHKWLSTVGIIDWREDYCLNCGRDSWRGVE